MTPSFLKMEAAFYVEKMNSPFFEKQMELYGHENCLCCPKPVKVHTPVKKDCITCREHACCVQNWYERIFLISKANYDYRTRMSSENDTAILYIKYDANLL